MTSLANNCGVPGYGDPAGLLSTGAIAVYILGVVWLCYGMKTVSDEYFSPAINGLVRVYGIPPSVAGSILMAVGASTPELLASFIGTFVAAESNTGAGTVIGSILFNQLVIVGGSILASPGGAMYLPPADVARDMSFYAGAILAFILVFLDGVVTAAESWAMFAVYVLYAAVCAAWHRLEPALQAALSRAGAPGAPAGAPAAAPAAAAASAARGDGEEAGELLAAAAVAGSPTKARTATIFPEPAGEGAAAPRTPRAGAGSAAAAAAAIEAAASPSPVAASFGGAVHPPSSAAAGEGEDAGGGGGHGPPAAFLTPYEHAALALGPGGTAVGRFNFAFECVWLVAAWVTLGWFRRKEWHVTVFVLGFAWFILQCLYLTYWLEKSACVVGITPGAMGTILGAAGTSIPNLLCSVYVARQGHAVMAAGEVWGSNIWLVFVCMGLPWGIYSSTTGRPVRVQNSAALTAWIVACFLLFVGQSVYTGWRYTRAHAYAYLALYAAFVAFVFANESLHFVDSTA